MGQLGTMSESGKMSVLARQVAKSIFVAGDLLHRRPIGPRILIYHQVGSATRRQTEVTISNFRRQLDWLQRFYRIVDLTTAVGKWSDEGAERLAVLTFDDGYLDTYTTAFPAMLERRLPFTLYLNTRYIETGEPLEFSSGANPLTWEMVSEMVDSGLATAGAHTHSHSDLRTLDKNAIKRELSDCDELMRDRLGIEPEHFAYPWGYWSATADDLVRSRYSTAVIGGSLHPDPPADHHLLHRYPVQASDGFSFFKARMDRGLLLEERLRRRLRGYQGP